MSVGPQGKLFDTDAECAEAWVNYYSYPIRDRKAISKQRKEWFKNPDNAARHSSIQKNRWASYSDERRREVISSMHSHNGWRKPTSIERKVAEQLDRYGVRYIQQKTINKSKFILDFWLPDYQLVIECNGDYWHNLEKTKERDQRLEEYVFSKGKGILWLWEHEINDEWFDIADYLEV